MGTLSRLSRVTHLSRVPTVGLFGAVTVGVGAIVGGGIMALAGPALATAGPSTMIAFALNAIIALMTAMSFAEMSSAFPESGGTYAYARKVLSVRLAFATGWVVWLAHIVAGVLYALGFGTFAAAGGAQLLAVLGWDVGWGADRGVALGLALLATSVYAVQLMRSPQVGGYYATWGKVVVFGMIVAAGLWFVAGTEAAPIAASLTPFFSGGTLGLIQTMGLTFIALQGFEIIATMADEIEDAQRVVPKAMFMSLGVALAVYIPFLFVIISAGVGPGQHVQQLAAGDPDQLLAVSAANFLGPAGYWLVMVAAVLSMLSALHANVLAASRIASRMARDRALPWVFGMKHPKHGTPMVALLSSVLIMAALMLMVKDLSAAGAAASLIFLISFAFAHMTSYLARRRSPDREGGFRSPAFPLVPVAGGVACAGLALFQALAELNAGLITAIWLGVGVLLYISLFGQRAEVADAAAEAHDVELTRLRGNTPVLLVPIRNPGHAGAMAQVAAALLPPRTGKLWLLSIVPTALQEEEGRERLASASLAVQNALVRAVALDHRPEGLITVADEPWDEMTRVARARGCGSMLLGLGDLEREETHRAVERIHDGFNGDLTVLRAPPDWKLEAVSRIVVALYQEAGPDELRARLIGRLQRLTRAHVVYLNVQPPSASDAGVEEARRGLARLARDEVRGTVEVVVTRAEDIAAEIIERAGPDGLVVLSLWRLGHARRGFGDLAQDVARRSDLGLLMIGRN